MRSRAATIGDLEGVFRDLSTRMSDEYVAAGKDSKVAYDNLMMNLKEGRAHALVDGDRTVAIIAWHENSDAADTLFAAQEDFFRASTGSMRSSSISRDWKRRIWTRTSACSWRRDGRRWRTPDMWGRASKRGGAAYTWDVRGATMRSY